MTSLNPQIQSLHEAYCATAGLDLPMNACFERWWHGALQFDVTPEMVSDVLKSRLKRDYSSPSMRLHCLSLRHCIGDEERLAQFVNEAAQIAAMKRKRLYVPDKASVLRETGRVSEPEALPGRHVSDIFNEMRKAT